MPQPSFRHPLAQAAATVLLFLGVLWLHDWMLRQLEFLPGIQWIYLPAGMRLLCTLLFAEAGVLGLLVGATYSSFGWFFPDDLERATLASVVPALAPYVVYCFARHAWGVTLDGLTPRRLLALALATSLVSPLLHHLWFAWCGGHGDLVQGFLAMFVGDLLGTLVVLYALRAALALVPRPAI